MLARNHHRQTQGFPRAAQPVHRDHRDIGRHIGHGFDQRVVNAAHIPEQGFIEGGDRLGQQGGELFDDLAGRQQQRHLVGIVHRQGAAQHFLENLAVIRIFQRRRHGDGCQRPELAGTGDGVLILLRQHQRLAVLHIGVGFTGDQGLRHPVPHRHQAAARDAPLLLGAARCTAQQILKRMAEQAKRRQRTLMMVAAQHGTKPVEDVVMRQATAIHQPVHFHRHGKTRRHVTRQSAEKRLEQSCSVHCGHRHSCRPDPRPDACLH